MLKFGFWIYELLSLNDTKFRQNRSSDCTARWYCIVSEVMHIDF